MDYEYNRNRVIRAALKGIFDARPNVKATLGDTGGWEEEYAGPTRNPAEIIKNLVTCDMEAIRFIDENGEEVGWINLVHDYGSNPGEIMQNWTVNLEENGALEKAHDISGKLLDTWE